MWTEIAVPESRWGADVWVSMPDRRVQRWVGIVAARKRPVGHGVYQLRVVCQGCGDGEYHECEMTSWRAEVRA